MTNTTTAATLRTVNHAIPTLYCGIEYRSRLEARWAAFFDQIGWRHTYEPFDANGYIPDFLIHGAAPLLAEIKPAVTEADYRAPIAKIEAGLRQHWARDILILGADPLPGLDNRWEDGRPVAGLLGEWDEATYEVATIDGVRFERSVISQMYWACPGTSLWEALQRRIVYVDVPGPHWHIGPAQWFQCGECRQVGVFHGRGGTGEGRPCDHRVGFSYINPAELKDAWAQACNAVKWRGRDAS